MTPGIIPKNEVSRLKALKKYRILDTPIEKEFEDITKLASKICGTKVSAISLIDRDRQWFKSIHGLDVQETPRELSFCGHAINDPDEVMVVEDAHADERFSDNPLVSEDPGITFYAGAPIVNKDGYALGTLCVFDDQKITFTNDQKESLRALSQIALRQMEQRLINTDLESYLEVQTQKLQDTVEELEKEVEQRKVVEKDLEKALASEKEVSELRANIVHSISHQFKTPLTAISSSAQLVDMMTDPSHEKMMKHIHRIKQSVKAMSRMTEDVVFLQKVDWDSASKDLNEVDLERLLNEVIKFEKSDCLKENEVDLDVRFDQEFLTNSHLLEKLFHILINNAFKYGQKSPIKIKAEQNNSTLNFQINNEGDPLNNDNKNHIFDLFFRGNNIQESEGIGIGLTIAKRIVDSLNGEISFESNQQTGTTFKIIIPESKKGQQKNAA